MLSLVTIIKFEDKFKGPGSFGSVFIVIRLSFDSSDSDQIHGVTSIYCSEDQMDDPDEEYEIISFKVNIIRSKN
jgi:hypothetical protein